MMANKIAIVCTKGIAENGLNTVRSLGKKGLYVIVVGIKGDENFAKTSRYCSRYEEIRLFEKNILLDKLDNIRNEMLYNPILFFDNDYMPALLDGEEELLRGKFILTQSIDHFSSKEYQMETSNNSGIDVPKTWKPRSWSELRQIGEETSSILISKPSQNSGKKPFKTLIASDVIELEALLKEKVSSPDTVIVQEYVEGNQENIWVVLGYVNVRKEFSPILTGVKYSMSPPAGGVMAIGKVVKNDRLVEVSKRLIIGMKYFGIFGLEFKYSSKDDKYYFIELSPRTEGFHNMTRLIGVDLPMVAYNDLFLNNGVSNNIAKNYNGYWINIRYFIESLVAQKSIKDIRKLIVAFFTKNNFQHFDIKDLQPLFVANKWYLKIWIKRIKKKF